MQCYSVRDEKAACFFSPYFAKNQTEVVRGLTLEVNNPQSNLCQFTDDFSLYLLGVVDLQTGVITPHKNGPERVVQLTLLKNNTQSQPTQNKDKK